MKAIAIFIVIAGLFVSGCSTGSAINSKELIPLTYDPARECLALGLGVMRVDEILTLTLGLKNTCAEPLTVYAEGRPAHDFLLLDDAESVVWRWRDFPILDVLEQFTLGAGEEMIFEQEFDLYL